LYDTNIRNKMSGQDIYPSSAEQLSIGGEQLLNVGDNTGTSMFFDDTPSMSAELPTIIPELPTSSASAELPTITPELPTSSASAELPITPSKTSSIVPPPASIINEDIDISPIKTTYNGYLYYIIITVIILAIGFAVYYFRNDIMRLYDNIKSYFYPEARIERRIKKQEKKLEKSKMKLINIMNKGEAKYCFLGKNDNGKNICAPISKHRDCQSGKLMYLQDCANL
jgi:hypothetical protein